MSTEAFPNVTMLVGHDQCLGDKDAQLMQEVLTNHYDFVVSSHCLEHMNNPEEAIRNWIRITKRLGYIVVTVPDWDMYEHRHWPSRFNGDHKTSWTLDNWEKQLPAHVIKVPDFLNKFSDEGLVHWSIKELRDGFDPNLPDDVDQTALIINGQPYNAECCIEFVLQKI